MSTRELPSSAQPTDGTTPDPRAGIELIPPEDFIRRLHTETLTWLTEGVGAQPVVRFNRDNVGEWGHRIRADLLPADFPRGVLIGEDRVFPEIPDWDFAPGRHETTVGKSIGVDEAAILRNEFFDFAVVLGNRELWYGNRGLSLQCGYVQHGNRPIDRSTSYLRALASRFTNPNGTVDFMIMNGLGPTTILVDGWANNDRYIGGVRVRDSKDSPIRTESGFSSSMTLIKDTLTRGHGVAV